MIVANLKRDTTSTIASGILWQYDYGQVLRLHGLDLPETVEVHFALKETDGDIVTRIGKTTDGVTDVAIPDTMLEGNDATYNFKIFAFVYLTDETSGETVCKIILPVTSRPKARAIETPEEEEAFRASILALINEAINEVKDDVIPYVGENGNWFINGQDTEIQSRGEDGYTPVKGVDYFDGKDGYTPVKGVDYFDGQDGKDGYTPVKGVDYTDGKDGKDGAEGQPGKDGQDGYTPVKGVDYKDGDAGKSAYQYAVDGGYTGTEYEFSKKLAEEGCSVTHFAGGEEITVIDKSEIELKGLSVFGKSEQKTTTGSNLFNEQLVEDRTGVGVTTVKQPDGGILVTGTSLGSSRYLLENDREIMVLEAGTYTFSMIGQPSGMYSPRLLGADKEFYKGTFTLTESTTIVNANLNIDGGGQEFNNVVYLMLNKGDKALPWEPYTGGPSPNPQFPQAIESVGDGGSVEVKVFGKNLINQACMSVTKTDKHWLEAGTYTVSRDYTEPKNGWYFGAWDKNDNVISTQVLTMPNIANWVLSASGEYVCGAPKHDSITFELTEDCYVKIGVLDGSGTTYLMLEAGTEATPYEPYKTPQTLAIPTPNGLPGIKVTKADFATYTGAEGQMWCSYEINFKRGVHVQRIYRYIPNGDETINELSNKRFQINVFKAGHPIALQQFWHTNIMCSHLRATTTGNIANATNACAIDEQNLYIRLDDTATVDDVRSLLRSGIVFDYILAEPIETPLTAEELAQYEALYANYPTTFIMNASDAWMELEYKIGIKNYVDVEHARIEENTDKKIEEATEYILEQIPSGEPSEITKADLDTWYDEIEV